MFCRLLTAARVAPNAAASKHSTCKPQHGLVSGVCRVAQTCANMVTEVSEVVRRPVQQRRTGPSAAGGLHASWPCEDGKQGWHAPIGLGCTPYPPKHSALDHQLYLPKHGAQTETIARQTAYRRPSERTVSCPPDCLQAQSRAANHRQGGLLLCQAHAALVTKNCASPVIVPCRGVAGGWGCEGAQAPAVCTLGCCSTRGEPGTSPGTCCGFSVERCGRLALRAGGGVPRARPVGWQRGVHQERLLL